MSQRLKPGHELEQAREDVAEHKRFLGLCKDLEQLTEERGDSTRWSSRKKRRRSSSKTKSWSTGDGFQPAQVRELTADTAYFWFFNADNVEALVKVLNACDVFGQVWIFTSGLTDVATRLKITDTDSGTEWVRETPAGAPYAPLALADAFQCPDS